MAAPVLLTGSDEAERATVPALRAAPATPHPERSVERARAPTSEKIVRSRVIKELSVYTLTCCECIHHIKNRQDVKVLQNDFYVLSTR